MGGSTSLGNATPVAEFNVWHDPEAAAIVLGAGLPITLYGLDVFYQVTVDEPTCEKLAVSEQPAARLAGQLLRHQIELCRREARVPHGGLLGDAGAVAAAIDPDGIDTEYLPVRVELAPGWSRGQTLVDRRCLPGEAEVHGLTELPPRIDVALGVDAMRYRQMFVQALLRPGDGA